MKLEGLESLGLIERVNTNFDKVNPVRKSSTFQGGGSHGALNPVFALKGIISSSPLQAAGLSNGVNRALERVGKDLTTARTILKIDEEWAYTISYHAMLRAGRALMLSLGYRPKGKDQHKTVVEFCSKVLGEEYRMLINKFHRMRQKRHKFVYEFDSPISKSEADQSIKNAKKLIDAIYEVIKGKESGFFRERERNRPQES